MWDLPGSFLGGYCIFSMFGVKAKLQYVICRVLPVIKSLFKKIVDLFLRLDLLYRIQLKLSFRLCFSK